MDQKRDDLATYSNEELEAELGRRRGLELRGSAYDVEQQLWEEDDEKKRQAFETYIQKETLFDGTRKQPCPRCGTMVAVKAKERARTIESLTGTIRYKRNYHYCLTCAYGFYPVDQRLGISEDGALTPAMERRVLDFGVNDCFDQAAARWEVHYDRPISANLIKRVITRKGKDLEGKDPFQVQAAMCPAAPSVADQLIVQIDGSMVPTRGDDPWREVKLGVIVRGDQYLSCHQSTRGQVTQARYVAHLGNVDGFKRLLDAALNVERADEVNEVFVVADGAPWIWNLAAEICPSATQILDWPHAAQAVAVCATILFGKQNILYRQFYERATTLIYEGQLSLFFKEIRDCLIVAKGEEKEALIALNRYLQTNRSRLQYKQLRDRGIIIGSGMVESANKHVVQQRMKRAGQHWHVVAADRMAALRAAYKTSIPKHFHAALQKAA